MQEKIWGAFLSPYSLKRQNILCEPVELGMLYGLFVGMLCCFKVPWGIRKFNISNEKH